MLLACQYLTAGRGYPARRGRATLPRSDTAVSLESQKLRHRRGLIGAAALAAAVTAGLAAAGGTVYVSDTGANEVSAVAGGATTAFAGSLTAFGEHGDGGQATGASLYHPGGTR